MSSDAPISAMPPYVPYATFSNFISTLADHAELPSHIDKSLMSRMSGSGQSSLTAALKSLNLINMETEPTQHLSKLVYATPEERKELFTETIKRTYGFLFENGFNISNTTAKQVEAKFREHANASGSTLTKCISFFLSMAKDSYISVSPHVKAPTPTKSAGASRRKKPPSSSDKQPDLQEAPTTDSSSIPTGMTKFLIPLKDTDDGIIYLPDNLTEMQAAKAIKMADFILRNYYELDED